MSRPHRHIPVSSRAAAASPAAELRLVRYGLLALVAIMPFHAFLSVWAGHLFGHQSLWQSWKEVLLLILTGFAAIGVFQEPARLKRLHHPAIYASLGFVVVGLVVSLAAHVSLTAVAFGLKTDTEFLLAMMLAWLASDRWLTDRLQKAVLATSGLVILFGLLQVYVLPADWLAHFGYGPATIQPYLRVDPAVKAVRILSTLGGPNQFGSFLLLPLGLVGWRFLRRPRWWQIAYLIAGLVVLWHTYARSAALGIAVVAVILLAARLPKAWRLPSLIGIVALVVAGLFLVPSALNRYPHLQYYIFHETAHNSGAAASTDEHEAASRAGLRIAEHHLGGMGLGSAGPATFHTGHPLIPEDDYLQLAIETGIIGLLLFMAIQISLGWRLTSNAVPQPLGMPLVATLVGIGVINFFLHGWADSSTALVFWTTAGAAAGAAA